MDKIIYHNEDEDIDQEFDKEEFVRRHSWDIPFEFVQEQADKDEEIRMPLYHQLLKRAKAKPYSDRLKESPYYVQLYQEIVNGSNETDKIDLAIYYDNDLIETIFGGINNLIDGVLRTPYDEETFFTSAMKLVDISEFDIDDATRDRIKEGITTLMEKDFAEMDKLAESLGLPKLNPASSTEQKNKSIQSLIEKVEKNKTK